MPALLTRMSTPLSCSCMSPIMSLPREVQRSGPKTTALATHDDHQHFTMRLISHLQTIAHCVHILCHVGQGIIMHLMAAGFRRSALLCATCAHSNDTTSHYNGYKVTSSADWCFMAWPGCNASVAGVHTRHSI